MVVEVVVVIVAVVVVAVVVVVVATPCRDLLFVILFHKLIICFYFLFVVRLALAQHLPSDYQSEDNLRRLFSSPPPALRQALESLGGLLRSTEMVVDDVTMSARLASLHIAAIDTTQTEVCTVCTCTYSIFCLLCLLLFFYVCDYVFIMLCLAFGIEWFDCQLTEAAIRGVLAVLEQVINDAA